MLVNIPRFVVMDSKVNNLQSSNAEDTQEAFKVISPSEQTQPILEQPTANKHYENHPIFTQMSVLLAGQASDGAEEWRETARWVKFEENVEEGSQRWSKPHVSTVSLNSLFKLKTLLQNGIVILNADATSMEQIVDMTIENMIKDNTLDTENVDHARNVLLRRHRHQHEMRQRGLFLVKDKDKVKGSKKLPDYQKKTPKHVPTNGNEKHYSAFLRKLPKEAEASNILVGEVDFVDKPLAAFIRLNRSILLGDLTEVPVPSRFIFILLGPFSVTSGYREVGRAMAILMMDGMFREVAYWASNKNQLLVAIDGFLNELTVLPPSEWDPNIRIEPPAETTSQESRYRRFDEKIDEEHTEDEELNLRQQSGLVRTGVLFGGLSNDLKRKSKWYWSDFKDALSMQCFASWIFLYFACLSPIITFGGLLSEVTGHHMAAMESLISGFVCGMIYGLFSGQPLSILGSTGPVLVFEAIVYEFCLTMGWEYLSFRFWIGTWIAIILLILVAIDASAFVCYITKFTEENFATLIAIIFIYEAFENVVNIGKKYPIKPLDLDNLSYPLNDTGHFVLAVSNSTIRNHSCLGLIGTQSGRCLKSSNDSNIFLMSILLSLGTFIISIKLKQFKNALFFPSKIRQFSCDFAVIIAIISMTLLDLNIGIPTPKLVVPNEFKPTLPGRAWIVSPFGRNPLWSILLAIPPALLGTILIFMDQQITAVIVNRKEYNLKKGCGYHLDLFILSILIQICTCMGLPWFVAATVMSLNHIHSLKIMSECTAPGDKPQFLGVREQRVTHMMIFFSIGLSVFLTPILGHIPMPVLYGVFLYMGVTTLEELQLFDRISIMFMPNKYQPDYLYLRKVAIGRVHLFTIIQIACLAGLWLIKSFRQTSILFPIMLVVMVGVRKSLDFIFTQRELDILDDRMPKTSKRFRTVAPVGGWASKISRFMLGPKLMTDKQHLECNQTTEEC